MENQNQGLALGGKKFRGYLVCFWSRSQAQRTEVVLSNIRDLVNKPEEKLTKGLQEPSQE